MDFKTYQLTFMEIMADTQPSFPYDNPDYLNYTRLNWARLQRWLKAGILDEELVNAIIRINEAQFWTVITEPWCGDAAHTLPFVHRLSELNALINVDYQLRDTPPFLINSYLTNGSKSIPKLVIKNNAGQLIGVWGPRPANCQRLYDQMLSDHVDIEQKKLALQQWYNADKGLSFQNELLALINSRVRVQF